MSKLLQAGLIFIGAGVFVGYGMALFHWGPCGPSSIWGLGVLLWSLVCLTIGSLLTFVGLVRVLVQRI
jgi:hypothetical protein